jgi:predicted nucleic acid-binding protein
VTAGFAEPGLRNLTGPLVIDASVAVEYLVVLRLAPQARWLFRAIAERDVELWAPDLLYPESVSALRRLVALRAIGADAGALAVERLGRLPLTIAGTRTLMARAWQVRDTVTPYDACYLALAEAIGTPFVTADRRLARTPPARDARVLFLGDLGGAT